MRLAPIAEEMRALLPPDFVPKMLDLIKSGNDNQKKADKTVKLLKRYGFEEIMLGTNVLTLKHPNIQGAVLKVAMDIYGQKDGIRDKWYSKMIHYMTDVYYVAPQGVYSIQEKIKNFKDEDHFKQYIPEVIHILESLINDYDMLLVDVSLKTIYNFGLNDKGLVKILDGSDMFQLLGMELYCDEKKLKKAIAGTFTTADKAFKVCEGKLEYDDDYHMLVCKKCGRKYLPSELLSRLKKEVREKKMRLSHGLNDQILDLIGEHRDAPPVEESDPDENIRQISSESLFFESGDDEEKDPQEPINTDTNDTGQYDEPEEPNETSSDYKTDHLRSVIIDKETSAGLGNESENQQVVDCYSYVESHDNAELGEDVHSGILLTPTPVSGYNVFFTCTKDGRNGLLAIEQATDDAEDISANEAVRIIHSAVNNAKMVYMDEIDEKNELASYVEIRNNNNTQEETQ